jgi:hypothetical protein
MLTTCQKPRLLDPRLCSFTEVLHAGMRLVNDGTSDTALASKPLTLRIGLIAANRSISFN